MGRASASTGTRKRTAFHEDATRKKGARYWRPHDPLLFDRTLRAAAAAGTHCRIGDWIGTVCPRCREWVDGLWEAAEACLNCVAKSQGLTAEQLISNERALSGLPPGTLVSAAAVVHPLRSSFPRIAQRPSVGNPDKARSEQPTPRRSALPAPELA
jgi:hypothetical protein